MHWSFEKSIQHSATLSPAILKKSHGLKQVMAQFIQPILHKFCNTEKQRNGASYNDSIISGHTWCPSPPR
eukprot:scaffold12946_cov116-Cylindrotheca_fusiformis.AAC.2